MKRYFYTLLALVCLAVSAQASVAESGKTYRISSSLYGTFLSEDLASGNVKVLAADAGDYAQYWTLTGSGTTFALRNVLTGRYIQRQNGASSVPYKTGDAVGQFTFAAVSGAGSGYYTIADRNGIGLHAAATQNYNVVGWDINAEASLWLLTEASVDEGELARQQAEVASLIDMQNNSEAYTKRLAEFFTDPSCSTLKAAYQALSDSELRTALADLPANVQDMAVKVKNNAWEVYEEGWAKTEQTFRVADYQPYTNISRWGNLLGMSYGTMGRLTNPTGITAKHGDILSVYVGEVPEGESIALEAVTLGSSSGVVYNLTPGINTIYIGEEANIFVSYFVDNTTNGRAPFKPIADYPNVRVHIEGGTVNGYFDLTKGDTDDDWVKMQRYLLKSEQLNLKTSTLVFNMRYSLVKKACPEHMKGLMEIWDGLNPMIQSYMGLEDYQGYYRNTLSCCSMTGSSYMHATTYGTFYNETTLSDVMNYEKMRDTGVIWGPAHENGHEYQKFINMISCTEVSNNVFSNIAVYNQGHMTQRSLPIATTFDNFHKGMSWLERHNEQQTFGKEGIWEQTHLYFQLWQYFHLRGFNPNFYPNLFKAFRKSPMNRNANVFVPASEDYLKFYVTCCQASGYDLTEFFDAYGFFTVPEQTRYTLNGTTREAYKVTDYSDFYVYVNQMMINTAKNQVAALKLPKANIIFIEDRITTPDAEYEGHEEGEKKTSFDRYSVGAGGRLGQYTDFFAGFKCDDYYYTMTNAGRVTVRGNGAVGFKVYDAQGQLKYLSNTTPFTLPEDLRSDFTLVAAEGNGYDVVVPNGKSDLWTLETYYGTNEKKLLNSDGRAITLPANALAVVKEKNAPAELAASNNVVAEGTAENLVLADNADFYSPAAFTAKNLTFTGSNEAATTALFLPFAVEAADFGSEATLETIAAVSADAVSTAPASEVAGMPAIVRNAAKQWNITKTNAEVLGSETEQPSNGVVPTLAATAVGAGTFLLNADGTAFEATDEAATVGAFRFYIASGISTADTLPLTVTGINSLSASHTSASVYDLQGRRVSQPVRGSIYIVDGKKVLAQ